MAVTADGGVLLGVNRFDEVFDDEPRAADAADEFFPAVQIFTRARLAQAAAVRPDRRARSQDIASIPA